MTQHLTLVRTAEKSNESETDGAATDRTTPEDAPTAGPPRVRRFRRPSGTQPSAPPRDLLHDERGAVTAEYAIIIMAAVAFAGLLVAIMSSSEVRAMLVGLVESALSSAG